MSLDTRGLDPQRLLPQSVEDRLLGWLSRAGGLLLLAVVTAVWASLASWSVSDPSLTHATTARAGNWLGPFGAIMSDLLLQTVGLAAVIALAPPVLWSFDLLRLQRLQSGRVKFGYYALSILATAGAVSAWPIVGNWPLHHGFGGALGDGLFNLLSGVFALLNEQRSGLAAGLVLLGAAVATTTRSFADSTEQLWRDVASAVLSLRDARSTHALADEGDGHHAAAGYAKYSHAVSYDDDDELRDGGRREPSLSFPDDRRVGDDDTARGQSRTRSWWPFGSRAKASPTRRQTEDVAYGAPDHTAMPVSPYGAGAVLAVEQPQAPPTYYIHPVFTPPMVPPAPQPPPVRDIEQVDPRFWPAPVRTTAPAVANHMQQAPAGMSPYAAAHMPPQSAPAAREPHGGVQPQSTPPTEEEYRGLGFDASTDVASQAIARRFAPGAAQAIDKLNAMQRASEAARRKDGARAAPSVNPRALVDAGLGLLGGLSFGTVEPVSKRPPLNLLKKQSASKPGAELSQTVMRGNARLLEDVLTDFGVKGEVKDIRPGPVVTMYELEPARGTKSSRVIGLADDIARSMSVVSVRAAVVPGRNAIGLEMPNLRRETVGLREMLESEAFARSDAALPLALGKGISGETVVADLARMPHLLVAGTTGSGKSVGINAMILSLLYRHAPEDCRLLMIDPKMLELSVYNGIPHLLTPVVVDPAKAVIALNWAVSEMEERYKRMAALNVRNIDVYNNRIRNAKKRGDMLARSVQTGYDAEGRAIIEKQQIALETIPRIVIVVDEFADLMMVAGKDVEAAVQRLAQMARAAGIHLIMATQRPSVDVITGTIKANFPTRISFKVTSKVDSRTILNEQGAEQLLGQGDMLFSTGAGQIVRVHGAFVSDEEVEAISKWQCRQGEPNYIPGILDAPPMEANASAASTRAASDDDLFDRAVALVMRDRKASTSYLQRRLSIGYNRAADLIERMERDGLISAADNVGRREILASSEKGSADAA